MNQALFLDRDGVINIDYGHVHTQERFIFNEDIFDIVSLANKRGFLVIVVTNQAGIAKGMYTEKDFVALTKWMSKKFQLKGAKINKTYYCPYHENASIKEYRKKSFDRKPSPGMIQKACKEFNIDPKLSIIVGNKKSDIEAGIASNIKKTIYYGPDKCDVAYKSIRSLCEIKEELIF